MYDPCVEDLNERKRILNIWKPLSYEPVTWKSEGEPSASRNNGRAYTSPENDIGYVQIGGTDRVTSSEGNSGKVVDSWMLPHEQATPITLLKDALTPSSWYYNNWSSLGKNWPPLDMVNNNAGNENQLHLPLAQKPSLRENMPNALDTTNGSLNTLSNDSTNGSATVATSEVSPQTDFPWLIDTSDLSNTTVIEHKSHWLTNSIAFIRCNPFYTLECALKKEYLVIKIENIPWVVLVDEIKKEFNRFILPPSEELDHNTHVMMDISTGKTVSHAYFQVIDCDYNRRLLQNDTKSHIIHCRHVRLSICSQDDFLRALYPSWAGTFQDGKATLPADSNVPPVFITQRELQSLGIVCKGYKSHYNRKTGERPFYYMKSLILNLPWHQEQIVTTSQRDILYEAYKIMTKYLVEHNGKQHTPFDDDALSKFVRPALLCCGFTPKQRRSILKEAHVTCPPELAYSIQDPILPQDTPE